MPNSLPGILSHHGGLPPQSSWGKCTKYVPRWVLILPSTLSTLPLKQGRALAFSSALKILVRSAAGSLIA